MRISIANFANCFEAFLGYVGIGLFPIGMKPTNCPGPTPYEIVWGTDPNFFESTSRYTLLATHNPIKNKTHLPNRISQIRALLYSSEIERATPNDQHAFAAEYRRIQDIIDAAINHLNEMKNPQEELEAVLKHATEYGDSVQNLLYITVLLSALGDKIISTEKIAEFFEISAQMVVDYSNAHALLMEVAAAYDKEAYAMRAALAWERSLPPEIDPIWDPIRIFAGLRLCRIAKDFDLMTRLLLCLKKLYPDTGYEHDLRIAWSSLKSAVECNAHPGSAWESAARRMRQTSWIWEHAPAHLEHLEALSCFASTAEIIAYNFMSLH